MCCNITRAVPCQAVGAEVVVVFEGTSEFGHPFSSRQSYLPREVHWGFQFVQIVHPADPGSTQHTVDISRCVLVPYLSNHPTLALMEAPPAPTLLQGSAGLGDEAGQVWDAVGKGWRLFYDHSLTVPQIRWGNVYILDHIDSEPPCSHDGGTHSTRWSHSLRCWSCSCLCPEAG